MENRFSLKKFRSIEDIEATQDHYACLQPIDYSKFKFGCKTTAREFGHDLANGFSSSDIFKEIIKSDKTIVVLSSPYLHIPTATFAMKDYFVRTLNSILVDKGCSPVQESKVYRRSSYKEEYGEMTKEQRMSVMKGDFFYLDQNFLKGRICLFLDDIRITGAHEHRVKESIKEFEHCIEPYFIYYAELIDEKTDPSIENYLNYYFVKNLVDLDKILKNEEYIINTRVVKYILDSDPVECKTFAQYQKYSLLHTVYHYAIGNSYHLIPDYQKNLQMIKELL
jgi:hypothetical protein